ncbi:MAG: hypothetical protein RIQ46_360 [Pseudomonadota bacterium]
MKLAQGKRKQAGGKTAGKPVTAHPLFPAIVALWFGALFGLGSLAIRPALLEALVLKLHLDLVIPAAAPPLGMTARILLSLGLALAGGCLGAIIARRIARPKPEVRERRRGAVPLGREQYQPAAAEAPAPRRRALAVEEDYEPHYHHEYAPLPGGGAPQILDVSEFDFAQEDAGQPVAAPAAAASVPPLPAPPATGALDLSGFLAGEPAAVEAARPPAMPQAPAMDEGHNEPAFAAPARSFDMPIEAPALARFAAPMPEAPQPEAAEPQPFAPASLSPAPFAPPSFTAPFAAPSAPAEPLADQAFATASAQPAPAMADAGAATHAENEDETVDQIHAAALEALSQVELIERLARALQRRRTLAGSTAAAAYAAPFSGQDAAAEPVAEVEHGEAPASLAVPAPFAAPAELEPAPFEPIVAPQIAMPAALRPVGLDLHDDDGDDDLAAFLPPRHIAMPAAAPEAAPAPVAPVVPGPFSAPAAEAAPPPFATPLDAPVEPAPFAAPFASPPAAPEPVAEADEDALSEGYSSLLDLSRPAPLRTGFVRIEEPEEDVAAPEPVVVFPGQAQRFAAAQPSAESVATTPSAPAAAIAAPADGAEPLRRFDAPASAVPGAQPISAAPASPQDREEAERALRTALATLQRMSATG